MSSCVSPPAWEQRHLRDFVTKLVDGSHNPPAKQEAGHPMLSARNVEQGRIVFEGFRFISNEAFVIENARTRIAPGDVLLTIVGTIGRSAVVPEGIGPFALQRSVAVLAPKPDLLPKFLSYQLQSPRIQRHFEANARGTAQKGVYLKTLGETPIVVPPLGEQRDLVAEIEKQFSRLDEAVASLKRVKANLKRYKAAILKAAVEGRLVPTEAELARREGRSFETGAQLLQRILGTRRSQWQGKYGQPTLPGDLEDFDLPVGWTWITVSQLLSERIVNGLSVKESVVPTATKALRLSAMTEFGLDYQDFRYLPIEPERVSDIVVREGDFFVSRGNGSLKLVGRGSRAQAPTHDVIFPDTMMRVRFTATADVDAWVQAIWSARLVRTQVEARVKTTAGIYKIAQPELASITLPLPPLTEQHRIVAEVDRLLSIAREAEAEVDTNLKRAQGLRQGILAAAFSPGTGVPS